MRNYADFIAESSFRSPYLNDAHMQHIYDSIITNNDNRIRMAVISDVFKNKMPALQVCNEQIKSYAASNAYILDDEKNKIIGAMVQEALRELGYAAQNDISPLGEEDCFFTVACWYMKSGNATQSIAIKL